MDVDTTPNLTQLMAELGPRVEAAEIIQADTDLWSIVFDDEFSVEIEVDPDGPKLVFQAQLGEPTRGDELATYEFLLGVAALWRETGGLRMGLNAADNTVVQIFDVPLVGLELDALTTYLQNFVNSALQAKAFLSAAPGDDEARINPATNFLRV